MALSSRSPKGSLVMIKGSSWALEYLQTSEELNALNYIWLSISLKYPKGKCSYPLVYLALLPAFNKWRHMGTLLNSSLHMQVEEPRKLSSFLVEEKKKGTFIATSWTTNFPIK